MACFGWRRVCRMRRRARTCFEKSWSDFLRPCHWRISAGWQRLTGADLNAVVEDGKLTFAHERVQGQEARTAEEYFPEALETVRENRRRYKRNKPAQVGEAVKFGF